MKKSKKKSVSATSAATSSNDTTTKNGNDNDAIVSLLDDDKKQSKEQNKIMKRSIQDDAFSKINHSSKKSKNNVNDEPEIIDLLSDEDDDNNIISTHDKSGAKNDDDDDDEVIVIDAPEPTSFFASPTSVVTSITSTAKNTASTKNITNDKKNDNDDNEIMEMGTKNAMDLPHMRQHCTKHTFIPKQSFNLAYGKDDANYQSCDKCFCYVCDVPVQECKHWLTHCHADDKGRFAYKWKQMRENFKRSNGSTNNNHNDSDVDVIRRIYAHNDWDYYSDEDDYDYGYDYDDHRYQTPLEPDKVTNGSHEANSRVQCRKCKWWSRDAIHYFSSYSELSGLIEEFDAWCKACGRVISTDYFLNNDPSRPYVPKKGDISLGTKVIPFRIKARDPRKIEPYQQKWQEWEGKEGWIYNESEMKYDFFHHRIGPQPKLSVLLEVMSIVEESKIPHDRSRMVFQPTEYNVYDTTEVSGLETEALIIDDKNDRVIIEELHDFQMNGKPVPYNIEAKYDEKTQDGVSIALKI